MRAVLQPLQQCYLLCECHRPQGYWKGTCLEDDYFDFYQNNSTSLFYGGSMRSENHSNLQEIHSGVPQTLENFNL